MTTPEERLRQLLAETVDDVEPRDALDRIRARTRRGGDSIPESAPNRTEENPMSSSSPSRTWLWGALGAAAAVAAVIGGVAVLGNDEPGGSPGPTTSSSAAATSEASGSATASQSPTDGSSTVPAAGAGAVYFVGDTPHGPRLYREFQQLEGGDRGSAALTAALSAPEDPDYRSPWPEGTTGSFSFDGTGADGLIEIDLTGAALHDRPQGMSEAESKAAIEQLIYTTQAAVGARAPVQFLIDGKHSDTVLGQPTAEPLAEGDPLDVLALVSISDPAEGSVVSGTLQANGVASSFEATVPWEIRQGDKVVKKGFTTAEGWMDKLYPWSDTIKLNGLEPGTYTFAAMTDDPSGGAEGNGPYVDTRTFTIQ